MTKKERENDREKSEDACIAQLSQNLSNTFLIPDNSLDVISKTKRSVIKPVITLIYSLTHT